MKIRAVAGCLLVLGLLVFGQRADAAEPVTIGVLRFEAAQGVDAGALTSIEQFVYSQFTAQQRFRVLERAQMSAFQEERAFQMASASFDPGAFRELGAAFVVLGQVTQTEVSAQHLQSGVVYSANVSYGVRIIDVGSGAVTHSESFSTSRGNPLAGVFAGFTGDNRTPAGAVDIAIQQTRKKLTEFIGRAFSLSGQVVSVEQADRKGLPLSVLVSVGLADGVDRRTTLVAFTTQNLDVNGQVLVRKKPVGELTFQEAQGDHLSLFRIKKGGAEIGALAAAGATILVEFKR
jgi:hypothetical protein